MVGAPPDQKTLVRPQQHGISQNKIVPKWAVNVEVSPHECRGFLANPVRQGGVTVQQQLVASVAGTATPFHIDPVNEEALIGGADDLPSAVGNQTAGGDEVVDLQTNTGCGLQATPSPVVGGEGVQQVSCIFVLQRWANGRQLTPRLLLQGRVPTRAQLCNQSWGRFAVLVEPNDGVCSVCIGLIKTEVECPSHANIAAALNVPHGRVPYPGLWLWAVVDEPDVVNIRLQGLDELV